MFGELINNNNNTAYTRETFGNIAKKRLSFGASVYNCPNTGIQLK